MQKSPLVVHVEEPDTGSSWDYVFDDGPVIVGRSPEATLPLDRPFVSLHHGTFDFDADTTTYVDLDSRNGTLIDGAPRGADAPIPISAATDIRIGKLRLTVTREPPPAAAAGPAAKAKPNPFAPRPSGEGSPKPTDAVPKEDLDRIRRELAAKKAPAPPPALAPPALSPRDVLPSIPPAIEPTAPLPILPGREVPPVPREATPPRPDASPYDAGGTRAIPALPPAPSPARRPTRPSGSRAASDAPRPPRRVTRSAPARARLWLPITVALVVVGAAALLLATAGGSREREETDEEPSSASAFDTAPTGNGGAAVPTTAATSPDAETSQPSPSDSPGVAPADPRLAPKRPPRKSPGLPPRPRADASAGPPILP